MADSAEPPSNSPKLGEAASWLRGSRYRLLEPLGRGGMGEVFLAEDTVLRRKVAIKRLRAEYEDDRERLRRVVVEAHHAGRLADQRVAALLDVIENDPTHFVLVMEYVPGISLRDRLHSPLTMPEFWDIAMQCAEAVDVIHRSGYIHRDLKPENIMITPPGLVKVLDLGLSVNQRRQVADSASTLLLVPTGIGGTPAYIAPELYLGAEPSVATDVFSLGVVYYEMLAGQRPFDGESRDEVREKILHARPNLLHPTRTDVSPALDRLLACTLNKDPNLRPSGAEALLEGLVAARRGRYYCPNPSQAKLRLHARRALLVMLTSLVLIVTTGALVVSPQLRLQTREWMNWVALPQPRRVAVLPVSVQQADDHLVAFGLGLSDLLAGAFNRPDQDPGLRVAPMRQVHRRKVDSAESARLETGSNLALHIALSRDGTALESRIALWDARRGLLLDRHTVSGLQTEPSEFTRRVADAVATMLQSPIQPELSNQSGISPSVYWFWLEGQGYLSGTVDEAKARLALEHFELATSADSKFAPAWVGTAAAALAIFERTGEPEQLDRSRDAVETALALDPSDVDARLVRARRLANRKQWTAAISDYEWVAQAAPFRDEAYMGLEACYRSLGRSADAERVCKQAIEVAPNSYQRWWNLAYHYVGRDRLPEAETAFEGMIGAAPDFYAGYQGLGAVLVREGRYEEAVEVIAAGIQRKEEADAYSNLATAYFNLRNFDRAIETYQQAIALGQEQFVLWMNLADAYYCAPNMRDRAPSTYRNGIALGMESLKENPDDAFTLVRIGDAYARIGEARRAEEFLTRADALAGDDGEIYEWLGLAYWNLGRREASLAAVEAALRNGVGAVWLRDSALFDSLKADPEFRRLVADKSPAKGPVPAAQSRGG